MATHSQKTLLSLLLLASTFVGGFFLGYQLKSFSLYRTPYYSSPQGFSRPDRLWLDRSAPDPLLLSDADPSALQPISAGGDVLLPDMARRSLPSYALLAEHLLQDYQLYRLKNDKAPCIHPLLIEIARRRAEDMVRTEGNSSLYSNELLDKANFKHHGMFEYIVNTHVPEEEMPPALIEDTLRIRQFKTSDLYGCYYKKPYLIELWVKSKTETCPGHLYRLQSPYEEERLLYLDQHARYAQLLGS